MVYVLLNRFLADPRLTSLIPRKRGPIQGGSRLSADIDQLIEEVIETVYLTRQRPRLTDLIAEIRRRCRAVGLVAPSRKAIQARVNRAKRSLDDATEAKLLVINLRPPWARWKPSGDAAVSNTGFRSTTDPCARRTTAGTLND
jgi:hypothetical protein